MSQPQTAAPPASRGPTRARAGLAASVTVAVAASLLTVLLSTQDGAVAAGPVGTIAALPASATAGRGATLPFVEHEAENVVFTGTVIGSNRSEGTLAGEASGRKAVQLTGAGQYVEFTLTQPANALVARVSVPDSANGTGLTGSLGVFVNGSKTADLPVTSRYGWYYGSYPFTNDPGAGHQHHFYDESRMMFGSTLATGAKIRLQYGATLPSYTVDLVDFEQVAPAAAQPANSVSITDFGANPTGAGDSAPAFDQAVSSARTQGKTVWIPPGTFTVNRHVIVNNITVRGAGPWHSVLHGNGVGVYGQDAPNGSTNVHLSDFAIIGEVQERNDGAQVNAIGGALGGGSVVSNLWLQHTKVGLWLDGPFDGLTVTGNRILDQTADGLNLHKGITNTVVSNNFVRNTGDDGLAMWAEQQTDANDTFSHNTVILPILANNIAIYGGRDITVSDNVVADTLTQGGGLHFANRFSAVPVAGVFTVARNTTVRAGVLDPNWQFGVGAIWFDGRDGPMNNTINVTDLNLIDSSYEAIHFIDSQVTGVSFDGVTINGAGTFALQLQSTGSASFRNVVASHVGAAGIYNCMGGGGFTINRISGNTGWDSTFCGAFPPPVYTDPTVPPTTPPTGPPTTPPTTTPPTTAPPTVPPNGNLAQGRAVTATSATQNFQPANAVDGDANTYWESANGAFPQSLTVDLGSAVNIGRAVLKLPPATAWATRTQTLTVAGSTDGSNFSTIVGSAGYQFNPATGNTVTINFAGTVRRHVRITISANTGWPAGQLSELEVYPPSGAPPTTTAPPTTAPPTTPPPTGNLAAGRPVSASGSADVYQPANTVDGNVNSYWESTNNAFPQTLTVDLGSSVSVRRIVLKLPPAAAWQARTQTLAVSGSTDGSSFSSVVNSAGYRFDPATGNTVTITFTPTSRRQLRLTFTANTGWPAGQVSEYEVYST
jgi:hypothetical protein